MIFPLPNVNSSGTAVSSKLSNNGIFPSATARLHNHCDQLHVSCACGDGGGRCRSFKCKGLEWLKVRRPSRLCSMSNDTIFSENLGWVVRVIWCTGSGNFGPSGPGKLGTGFYPIWGRDETKCFVSCHGPVRDIILIYKKAVELVSRPDGKPPFFSLGWPGKNVWAAQSVLVGAARVNLV